MRRRLRSCALGAALPVAAVLAGGYAVNAPSTMPPTPVLRASVESGGMLPTGDRWLEIHVDDLCGQPAPHPVGVQLEIVCRTGCPRGETPPRELAYLALGPGEPPLGARPVIGTMIEDAPTPVLLVFGPGSALRRSLRLEVIARPLLAPQDRSALLVPGFRTVGAGGGG